MTHTLSGFDLCVCSGVLTNNATYQIMLPTLYLYYFKGRFRFGVILAVWLCLEWNPRLSFTEYYTVYTAKYLLFFIVSETVDIIP